MQITTSDVELTIDGFPCRTYVAAPKPTQSNAKYPGIVLYSEIFQLTGPICRTANRLAGHGLVVAAPEIYHRSCPPGLVIAYDDPGRMYGNYLAHTTPVAHFDATATAVFDHFETRGDVKHDSSGPAVGAIGFCIGGHLALRAALDPRCRAMVGAYPTGVHDGKLGRMPTPARWLALLRSRLSCSSCLAMLILIRRRLQGTSSGPRCRRPECGIPIWNCPGNMRSCGMRGRDMTPPWLTGFLWRRLGCIGGRSVELAIPLKPINIYFTSFLAR